MEKSFDNIFKPGYKISLDIIRDVLISLGYKIGNSANGIYAIKYVDSYRFHVGITLLPDGQADRHSRISIHKDMGTELFHQCIYKDDDVNREFGIIRNELHNAIKRKSRNFNVKNRCG